MAAPVVHLVRGLEWLEANGAGFERGAFARGSVFPDIRYLGVLRRDQTHDRPYTGEEVLAAPTAFEAGRRHHNLLDAAWNGYYHAFDWGVARSEFYAFAVALKSVEAMLVLAATNAPGILVVMLDSVDDEAVTEWGVDRADVERWQGLVRADLEAEIGLESQLGFLDRLEFEPRLAVAVRRYSQRIAASDEWRRRIMAFPVPKS